MKKLIASLLLTAGLAVSTQAAVIVAADYGYLLDSQRDLFAARAGVELKRSTAFAHQLELEVAYTEDKEAGLSADLLPVTLNYRLTSLASGPWGYSVGAGVGFARASIDGVSIVGPVRLRDESLALQGFATIDYRASEQVTLSVGAKYLWIDDVKFAGSKFEVGDDVALTAGVSFKF